MFFDKILISITCLDVWSQIWRWSCGSTSRRCANPCCSFGLQINMLNSGMGHARRPMMLWRISAWMKLIPSKRCAHSSRSKCSAPSPHILTRLRRVLNSRLVEPKRDTLIWYDQNASELADVTASVGASAALTVANGTESPTVFVHRERLIKSPAEIQLMRRTCDIAATAINRTMHESQPGDSEHHIFARVDYHTRMANASFLAYPPVVAGGANATTIHYINNTQIVNDGQLVLMDAGTYKTQ